MYSRVRVIFLKLALVIMFICAVGFVLKMFEATSYMKLFMALVFVITTSFIAILEMSLEGD